MKQREEQLVSSKEPFFADKTITTITPEHKPPFTDEILDENNPRKKQRAALTTHSTEKTNEPQEDSRNFLMSMRYNILCDIRKEQLALKTLLIKCKRSNSGKNLKPDSTESIEEKAPLFRVS